jgi:TetR/AcrR family transcriptional regulator, fatty acid metabolism regulator protein
VESSQPRPRTLPPETRREQIIAGVLRAVAEHGVAEATTARIAKAAGVSEGTLYLHFKSRTEMLTATLDSISGQMMAIVEESADMGAVEQLRSIEQRHSELIRMENGGFAHPWIEFIAAGTQTGLREAIAEAQRKVFREIRGVLDRGKAEGTIRQDLDSDRAAWLHIAQAWADNMAFCIGLDEYFDLGCSDYLEELLISDVETSNVETRPEIS